MAHDIAAGEPRRNWSLHTPTARSTSQTRYLDLHSGESFVFDLGARSNSHPDRLSQSVSNVYSCAS